MSQKKVAKKKQGGGFSCCSAPPREPRRTQDTYDGETAADLTRRQKAAIVIQRVERGRQARWTMLRRWNAATQIQSRMRAYQVLNQKVSVSRQPDEGEYTASQSDSRRSDADVAITTREVFAHIYANAEVDQLMRCLRQTASDPSSMLSREDFDTALKSIDLELSKKQLSVLCDPKQPMRSDEFLERLLSESLNVIKQRVSTTVPSKKALEALFPKIDKKQKLDFDTCYDYISGKLESWLATLGFDKLLSQFEELGMDELSDLEHITEEDVASLKSSLKKGEKKKLDKAIAAVLKRPSVEIGEFEWNQLFQYVDRDRDDLITIGELARVLYSAEPVESPLQILLDVVSGMLKGADVVVEQLTGSGPRGVTQEGFERLLQEHDIMLRPQEVDLLFVAADFAGRGFVAADTLGALLGLEPEETYLNTVTPSPALSPRSTSSAPIEMVLPEKEVRDRAYLTIGSGGDGETFIEGIAAAVRQLYPSFNNPQMLTVSFHAADANGSGSINKREFRILLEHLIFFNKVWDSLLQWKSSPITLRVFKKACEALGASLSAAEAASEFSGLSRGAERIRFDDLCAFLARKHRSPDAPVAAITESPELKLTLGEHLDIQERSSPAKVHSSSSSLRETNPGEEGLVKMALGKMLTYMQQKGMKPMDAFHRWDRDKSGDLNWPEFRDAMHQCAPEMITKQAEMVFNEFDGDGSGGLSLAEYLHVIRSLKRNRAVLNGVSTPKRSAPTPRTPSRSSSKTKTAHLSAASMQLIRETESGFVRGVFNSFIEKVKSKHNAKRILEKIDKDQSGTLDLGEVVMGLRDLGVELNEQQAHTLMKELDRNGDGIIEIQELLDRVSESIIKKVREKFRPLAYNNGRRDLKSLFRSYDMDNDSYITYDELRRAIRRLTNMSKGDLPDAELKDVFNRIDSDADGRITLDEFKLFLRNDDEEPELTESEVIFSHIYEFIFEKRLNPVDLFRRWAGDGKVVSEGTEITREQFSAGMSTIGRTIDPKVLEACFVELDSTADGSISQTEFLDMIRKVKRARASAMKRKSYSASADDPTASPSSPTPLSSAEAPVVSSKPRFEFPKVSGVVEESMRLLYSKCKSKDQAMRMFNKLDADKSGSLNLKELVLLFRELGVDLSEKQACALEFEMDINGDGRIETKEFLDRLFLGRVEILRKKIRAMSYNKGKEDWDYLFNVYDRDNDGTLNFEELRRAVRKFTKLTTAELPDVELKEIFDMIDEDGDRAVTLSEWKSFLKITEVSAVKTPTALAFDEIYDFVDHLGQRPVDVFRKWSGSGYELEFDEMKVALAEVGVSLEDPEIRYIFTSMDASGDGKISQEEFLNMLRQIKRSRAKSGTGIRSRHRNSMVINLDLPTAPTKEQRSHVFSAVDLSGNNALSFVEVDKAVSMLYPRFENRAMLMIAYKAADKRGNGFVNRHDFRLITCYLVFLDGIWDKLVHIQTATKGQIILIF